MSEHFQEGNPFLHGGDGTEGRVDEVLHHDLQVLHPGPEAVVVVMPAGALDVQDGLANALQGAQALLKGVFDLIQAAGDLRASAATKAGQGLLLALGEVRKVSLAFYNFQQVPTPLSERVDLSKYAGLVQGPGVLKELGVDLVGVVEDALPHSTAVHALAERRTALLHKPIKDIVQRYLVGAALDDFNAHLHRTEHLKSEIESAFLHHEKWLMHTRNCNPAL